MGIIMSHHPHIHTITKGAPLLRRLLADFIKPYQKTLGYAFICMIVGAAATAALPYLLKPIFDRVFINCELHMLPWVSTFFLLAFILKGASAYGETVLMTFVGQKIIADIQKELFKHLMQADLAYFHSKPTGTLLSHFTNDVTLMRNAMATTLMSLGKDTLSLVFLIGLMFYLDATLASIAFVVFPTAVLPIFKLGKRMRKITHKTQDQHAALTNELSQVFQGIRVVKAYGMEETETTHIQNIIDTVFNLVYKSTRIRASSHPIVESLAGFAIVGVIAYGGYQVINHTRTAGDFIAFITSLLLVYEPLKRISNLNSTLQEGLAAAARVFSTLDEKATIVDHPVVATPSTIAGEITFDHVSFAYQNAHDHKPVAVLHDISFSVSKGQTVAFVGTSGAGKSTIINLIPRFYDVTAGKVMIDGIDISSMPIDFLRSKIALVSQEIALFDRSIADNIAHGNPNYSMEEIQRAATFAAAHEFIEKLPHGYMTRVGENGVKLSGGQRQRIAIARAMLKNAPILLLDEATSSLDSESERLIQETLSKLMAGRTTILVAHRLSTVVDASCIYVMDHGRIIERGRHHDLLSIDEGLYAALWQQQAAL